MNKKTINPEEVAQFWDAHPLGSYEQAFDENIDDFYTFFDSKKGEASKFSQKLQEYEKNKGKKVLELGCGPGWNVKNLASHGAHVSACDITLNGANLAGKWLKLLSLKGNICVGNVEQSPL